MERNIQKWSKLSAPLFTPSTKAKQGHDENIDAASYFNDAKEEARKKQIENLTKVYSEAYKYAQERGFLILDTKFEGTCLGTPGGILADEILTPDSSRYVSVTEWQQAMEEKRDPQFYDKEVARICGAAIKLPNGKRGLKYLDPTKEENIKFVLQQSLPSTVKEEICQNYDLLFERITDHGLIEYQDERMGF